MGFLQAQPRAGIALRLGYRFERYDYGATALGPARFEQVRTVVAGIGVHFGK